MKEIIYNYDYLTDEDMNNYVGRAKGVIENSNGEILLAFSDYNYQLPGGHLEDNETYSMCIKREIKEEVGIDIPLIDRIPFLVITYYNKDYKAKGVNTKSVIKYFRILTDEKPNLDLINLTDDEKKGNFELRFIKKDKVIEELEGSIASSSRRAVVIDTIEAIKEYLKSDKYV